MASRADRQEVIVESDFLFGLRKSDARHSKVVRALSMHKQERLSIRILSSAVLEVRSVLYSRGLGPKEVEDAFSLMASMMEEYGLNEFIPIELSDVIAAERMRSEEPSLSFFDSLHGSVSKRLNLKLLSSEGIYARLGLQVIDLDRL